MIWFPLHYVRFEIIASCFFLQIIAVNDNISIWNLEEMFILFILLKHKPIIGETDHFAEGSRSFSPNWWRRSQSEVSALQAASGSQTGSAVPLNLL